MSKSTLYFRGIPRRTKERFKSYCADRGVSMTQLIVEMMEERVRGWDDLHIPVSKTHHKGGKAK